MTREQIQIMMIKFLANKRRKIKKIPRGKSGMPDVNSNWGYLGGPYGV